MGARSGALAGTGAADADDYSAAYLNPAALTDAKQRRLTFGYVGARYHLSLDGVHDVIRHTDGIVLGAALPIGFGGWLKDRVVLGLGFYFPSGVINRAADPYPTTPRLALLDDRTQVVSVLVAAGFKLHERVSIGGGVLALAGLTGTINLVTDAANRIITTSDEQLVTNFTPVVGVHVVATNFLQLGLTFRGESKSTYDLRVVTNLGSLLPLTLPVIRVAGTAQYDPLQLALEGAFAVGRLKLIVGATYKHWGAYVQPVDNATQGAPVLPPTRFHDTIVPRGAIEARFALPHKFSIVARGGYFFEESPSPSNQTILVDANRHVFTAGFAIEHSGKNSFSLDVFGQAHFLANSPSADGQFGVFGATFGVNL